MTQVMDLTRGIYRRIYSGFLTGRRINAVSLSAEAWFWRLQAIADDFGNLSADPRFLRSQAAPMRDLSASRVAALTAELVEARLITEYQSGDDQYLHIEGFEDLQPGAKNGRRVQRVPRPPEPSRVNPGESKAIRGQRSQSTTPQEQEQAKKQVQDQEQAERDEQGAEVGPRLSIGPDRFVALPDLPACLPGLEAGGMLAQLGVDEPVRTRLTDAGVTTAEIRDACEAAKRGEPRRWRSVMIADLLRRRGLKRGARASGLRAEMDRATAGALGQIEELRRTKGVG